MNKYGCKNMVFSSSCTVYGNPQVAGWAEGSSRGSTWLGACRGRGSLSSGCRHCRRRCSVPSLPPRLRAFDDLGLLLLLQYVPIDEQHPLKAVSPYGATKLMIEDILR